MSLPKEIENYSIDDLRRFIEIKEQEELHKEQEGVYLAKKDFYNVYLNSDINFSLENEIKELVLEYYPDRVKNSVCVLSRLEWAKITLKLHRKIKEVFHVSKKGSLVTIDDNGEAFIDALCVDSYEKDQLDGFICKIDMDREKYYYFWSEEEEDKNSDTCEGFDLDSEEWKIGYKYTNVFRVERSSPFAKKMMERLDSYSTG